MAAICVTPIKGTHIRIVKVDSCGIPVTGASAMSVVTKGFVKVDMEPQYEDGQEYFERNADGDPCVNQKDNPVLKRLQLTVELCEIDPTAASWMISARQLLLATDVMGWALTEGTPTNRFSFECWQRVAGAGACAAGGIVRYIYNAWPNVGAVKMGTYTVENGRSAFTFTAETAAASASGWGDGPGATTWLPGGVPVGSLDHWLWAITTNAPPTAVCGPSAIT
jgi:hypothetical protein